MQRNRKLTLKWNTKNNNQTIFQINNIIALLRKGIGGQKVRIKCYFRTQYSAYIASVKEQQTNKQKILNTLSGEKGKGKKKEKNEEEGKE